MARNFVATVDEVWRLDNCHDDDCLFFQKMADSGHAGIHRAKNSRQGIYVCTADGTFLSSINSLDPEHVLETLRRGWRRWNRLSADSRKPHAVTPLAINRRWEDLQPRNGLVLLGYTRDLHRKATPESKPQKTWNADSAWFSREEVRSMLPSEVNIGDVFEFPDVFVSRMARMHFVDCVKGQTDPFKPSEINGSTISAKVIAINDDNVDIELSGRTSGVCNRGQYARGLRTTLVGEATFDRHQQRFTRFDFVAIGQRWGRTRFNDRLAQQSESPIGFSFRMAEPGERVVVPGLVWAYRCTWLKF